jgi:hypothetical protein
LPIEVIDAGRDLAGKEPGGLVDLALVVGVDPTKAPRRRQCLYRALQGFSRS